MAQLPIPTGTTGDDGTGINWRVAWQNADSNFTELYGLVGSDNPAVFVAQESDFPTQDATTITLEAATTYVITASFSTAKSFTVETGALITAGNIFALALTYSGVGSMFTGTDVNFTIRDLTINCPTAQAFNATDTAGGRFVWIHSNITVLACTKWGTYNDLLAIQINLGFAVSAADGVTITGTTNNNVTFDKFALTSLSASFIGIDLGSSITKWEVSDLIFVAPAGAIGISGLVSSGNIPSGFIAMLEGSDFSGGMTALQNISQSDIRWSMRDNNIIPDSRNAADMYLTGGSETITTGSAGDWQEIGTPGGGGVSWASDISDRFTIGADGVITYDGEKDIEVRISGRATIEKSGGGSDVLEVRLALNWTGVVSDSGLEKSRAQTQNTDPTTVPFGALVALTNGDDLRVIFSNTTGTSNIIASVSALEIFD